MDYFDNKNIDEDERRNTAFQIVSSVREAINLARNEPNPITYEKTLDMLHDLNPNIYTPVAQLLKNKNESDTVKLYKELAEAQSTETTKISPVDLINEELHKMESVFENNADKKFIRKKFLDLTAAREFFTPRRISEHKALNHDNYLVDRGGYFSKPLYQEDNYKDYKLDNNRILRLRLLHLIKRR